MSADVLKQALTIAVRYGAVRQQHTVRGWDAQKNKTKQLHLLDLQSHQLSLVSLLVRFLRTFFLQKVI